MQATMDKRTIKASLAGRLRSPKTAETIAKEIGAPLLLVQEVLRSEVRKKGATIVTTGTGREDGGGRKRAGFDV